MKLFDWLGTLKSRNADINSLTDQLETAKGQAEMYRKSAELWKATALSFARKRLAAIAKYQDGRKCTCHPDDRPAGPCPRRYAASECRIAAAVRDSMARASA